VDDELGRANPYGAYDLGSNSAWVSVGTDHDTASFAVATVRRWSQFPRLNFHTAKYLPPNEAVEKVSSYRIRGKLRSKIVGKGVFLQRQHYAPNKYLPLPHYFPGVFCFSAPTFTGSPLRMHVIPVSSCVPIFPSMLVCWVTIGAISTFLLIVSNSANCCFSHLVLLIDPSTEIASASIAIPSEIKPTNLDCRTTASFCRLSSSDRPLLFLV